MTRMPSPPRHRTRPLEPETSQTIGFKVDNALVHGLDRIARRDSVTRAELLRKIVGDYVMQEDFA